MIQESYTGFYPSPSFWVDGSLDAEIDEAVGSTEEEITHLTTKIRSDVCIYQNNDYTLKVCKDGLILLRDRQIEERIKKLNEQLQNVNISAEERLIDVDFTPIWSEYLKLLNIIYLLMDCSLHNTKRNIYGIEYSELRVKDILRVKYKDRLPISQTTFGNENANTILRYNKIDINKYAKANRINLEKEVFDDLNSEFLSRLYGDKDKMELLSQIAKSLSEHNLRSYRNSFILSWFIIESYLYRICKRCPSCQNYLKSLKPNRYPEASKMIVKIKLDKKEHEDFYDGIDRLRNTRNNLIHAISEQCSAQDCRDSFQVLKKIAFQETGINLNFNTSGHPVHGL